MDQCWEHVCEVYLCPIRDGCSFLQAIYLSFHLLLSDQETQVLLLQECLEHPRHTRYCHSDCLCGF